MAVITYTATNNPNRYFLKDFIVLTNYNKFRKFLSTFFTNLLKLSNL